MPLWPAVFFLFLPFPSPEESQRQRKKTMAILYAISSPPLLDPSRLGLGTPKPDPIRAALAHPQPLIYGSSVQIVPPRSPPAVKRRAIASLAGSHRGLGRYMGRGPWASHDYAYAST
ncbi:hypothetical protein E2562_025992 [Oryza meyeriana var. granulata]|uniref:Uncharacterized protein n=1 Tax=Oryza meyeriana var. granulata TaxID=110450 RepID=A0A6G1EPI1_9ORYZ|nr:hypothetical protein E2562_025992 [Oryza meyeriana var. granulata]